MTDAEEYLLTIGANQCPSCNRYHFESPEACIACQAELHPDAQALRAFREWVAKTLPGATVVQEVLNRYATVKNITL